MHKIISRKYATAILYDHLSHGSDLIGARGMKRLFEYYATKNRIEATCLMRRTASHEMKSGFPDMQEAIKVLAEYNVASFAPLHPNEVDNDKYLTTLMNLLNGCLKHEKSTLDILSDEAEHADLEDIKVLQKFACESDKLCKKLLKIMIRYNKYGNNAGFIENDQKRIHDKYKKKTKEKFKMEFC